MFDDQYQIPNLAITHQGISDVKRYVLLQASVIFIGCSVPKYVTLRFLSQPLYGTYSVKSANGAKKLPEEKYIPITNIVMNINLFLPAVRTLPSHLQKSCIWQGLKVFDLCIRSVLLLKISFLQEILLCSIWCLHSQCFPLE